MELNIWQRLEQKEQELALRVRALRVNMCPIDGSDLVHKWSEEYDGLLSSLGLGSKKTRFVYGQRCNVCGTVYSVD